MPVRVEILSMHPNTIPGSTKLLRLVSARTDVALAIEAYDYYKTMSDSPFAEYFVFIMALSYGRPFFENHKVGGIQCDFPNYPDFPDDEMNTRHKRLIDLRNKFVAHSSADGTQIMIVPPGVKNPVTGGTLARFNHNIGKRFFLEPQYIDWLIQVVIAFMARLDIAVSDQIAQEFSQTTLTEPFELKTGWDTFSWTK